MGVYEGGAYGTTVTGGDGDLTAISAVSTTGYLRRTATDTWQTDLGVTISQSTTGTNATVNIGAITSSAPSTDAHIALIPKGTGGVIAAIPDGTAAGGNTRGLYAVDLQTERTVNVHVASGNRAVITGGQNNTASGAVSIVNGGNFNIASAQFAVILGGEANSNNGVSATCGGSFSHTQGRRGVFAYSAGRETVAGDSQYVVFIHRNRTSDTTATSLTSDSATVRSSTNIFFVQTYSIQTVKGLLNVIQENTANVASFEITFVVARGATAATTTIKGTPIVTSLVNDLGITFTAANIKADTTNGGAYLEVVGLAATNLQWVFSGYLTENKY